jgi:Domain of unknown function (DUF4276)
MIIVGLFTEGSTDARFLERIVKNTLDDLVLECNTHTDTSVKLITIHKTGLSFVEQVLAASKQGCEEHNIHILCVHTDADDISVDNAYKYKINPAKNALKTQDEQAYCKILVAIVPVQEIEAWMLADKTVLKNELQTKKTDTQLGIHRHPESINNPKKAIENAIRIAQQDFSKKNNPKLTISTLYFVIGERLNIEKLETLPSYLLFKEEMKNAFRALNLLY